MSEDLTKNLPPHSFEERVLSELAAIRGDLSRLDEKVDRLDAKVGRLEARFDQLEARVDALEEKVDRRLQETRPIWEDVQMQLRKLDTKFNLLIKDLYEVRHDQVLLPRRVDQIERQRAQQ